MDPAAWRNRRGEEAVVLHDFEAQLLTQLDLKKGTRLEVLERRDDGWWVGRREGKVGIVPSTRLALYKDKEYARALHAYQSDDPTHLKFDAGNRILVWRKDARGWCVGEREGVIGMFPGTFVEWLGAIDDDDLSEESSQSSRSGGSSRASSHRGLGGGTTDDGRHHHHRRTDDGAGGEYGEEPYESEDDASAASSEGLLSSNYSSENASAAAAEEADRSAMRERFARYRPAVPVPTNKDKDDIKVLLQMLDSSDDVQARAALEGMASFLAKDKSGLMAKRHGAIPGLVKRAQKLMHAGRPLVVKRELDRVLEFLNFLVEDDPRAAGDMHEVGATPQLIGFLATKAHDTTKEKARKLLVTISKDNPACQFDIVRVGGIPVLCKLMRSKNYDLRKDACVVMSRILYGIGTYAQIAVLASTPAMPAMVTALNTPRADVLEIAAANVTHLCRNNPQTQNQFRKAHGLLSIANLVGHTDPRVQLQAAGALMELARDNKANAKAISGGTTGTVHLVAAVRSQVMLEEPNEAMLNNVLGAIWMLTSQSKSNCAMFLEHGLLFALMPLVEREYRLAHVIAFHLQKHFPVIVVEQFWHYREEMQNGTYGWDQQDGTAEYDYDGETDFDDAKTERSVYSEYPKPQYGGQPPRSSAAAGAYRPQFAAQQIQPEAYVAYAGAPPGAPVYAAPFIAPQNRVYVPTPDGTGSSSPRRASFTPPSIKAVKTPRGVKNLAWEGVPAGPTGHFKKKGKVV